MLLLERLGLKKVDTEVRGQYASVHGDEHPSSKEELEVSLHEQHRALLESHRRLKIWLRGFYVAVGLLSVLLIVAVANTRSSIRNGKAPSPVPEFPKTAVKFERNETFAGPSTTENDRAWTAMMPAGDGFIIIDGPDEYHLPPGKSTKHGDVYDVSVFHQLHCLSHIRNHYYLTQLSLHSNNSDVIQEKLLRPQEDHVHHCFDYLRQGLMCMGDMTIEWPRTEEDGQRFAVDGWGITHECKSWDAIMEFMAENDVASKIWTA